MFIVVDGRGKVVYIIDINPTTLPMNTAEINALQNEIALAQDQVNKAGRALAEANDAMQAAGCSAESMKITRKARAALSTAKGKLTKLEVALWFAEHPNR